MNHALLNLKLNYETAADAVLTRKNDLKARLTDLDAQEYSPNIALEQHELTQRIEILTAEYCELRAVLRTLAPYFRQEVQSA